MKLICPVCKSSNLHQCKYEIWDRKEDTSGTYITINGQDSFDKAFPLPIESTSCPSLRRGGIRIHLWCEECSSIIDLSVYQEKGETFLKLNGNDYVGLE